jgi:hypothetical protein
MVNDNIGNTQQPIGKAVSSERVEVPAGTQIRIGGHYCTLRYGVVVDADPIYATFIKASIAKQHEPVGVSER